MALKISSNKSIATQIFRWREKEKYSIWNYFKLTDNIAVSDAHTACVEDLH